MNLYTGLIASMLALHGLAIHAACAPAAVVTESKEAKVLSPVGKAPSLVPLLKHWMVKPYKKITTMLEQGKDVVIRAETLAPFLQKPVHSGMPLAGTVVQDSSTYTVEKTPYVVPTYYSCGKPCYIKMLTAPNGKQLIAIPRNPVIYDVYEWLDTIDLAHLAVLSCTDCAVEQMKLLQTISIADTYGCSWPSLKYERIRERFVVMANSEDNKAYEGAKNERTLFKSLPSYLQKILLKRHPFLKESGPIDLPNVSAILRAKLERMREQQEVVVLKRLPTMKHKQKRLEQEALLRVKTVSL